MKNKLKFVVYLTLLVLLFSGLTSVAYSTSVGWLQISALGLFTALSATGLILWTKPIGGRLIFFVSLLTLINLVFIWILKDSLYLVLLFLAVITYLLGIPKNKTRGKLDKKTNDELHSMVFSPVEKKK